MSPAPPAWTPPPCVYVGYIIDDIAGKGLRTAVALSTASYWSISAEASRPNWYNWNHKMCSPRQLVDVPLVLEEGRSLWDRPPTLRTAPPASKQFVQSAHQCCHLQDKLKMRVKAKSLMWIEFWDDTILRIAKEKHRTVLKLSLIGIQCTEKTWAYLRDLATRDEHRKLSWLFCSTDQTLSDACKSLPSLCQERVGVLNFAAWISVHTDFLTASECWAHCVECAGWCHLLACCTAVFSAD